MKGVSLMYRYHLTVLHYKTVVFDGSFSTLNKLVKVACCFSEECTFNADDELFGKLIPVNLLIDEFKSNCVGL